MQRVNFKVSKLKIKLKKKAGIPSTRTQSCKLDNAPLQFYQYLGPKHPEKITGIRKHRVNLEQITVPLECLGTAERRKTVVDTRKVLMRDSERNEDGVLITDFISQNQNLQVQNARVKQRIGCRDRERGSFVAQGGGTWQYFSPFGVWRLSLLRTHLL